MDKQQRKTLVKEWKDNDQAALMATMPLTPAQLHRLLDYLDANLDGCDRGPKLTRVFIEAEHLPAAVVLEWLAEQGGSCDCEVLANLDELDEALRKPALRVPHVPAPNAPRTPRDLQNPAGWDLTQLPKPWRVANLYEVKGPIELQFGKKEGCNLRIIVRAFPSGDRSTDDYWSRLWCARTKLPPREPLRVVHSAPALPEGFQFTIVRSTSWTPVCFWITPQSGKWHLEGRSELPRWEGDVAQVASLIKHLCQT